MAVSAMNESTDCFFVAINPIVAYMPLSYIRGKTII